MGILDKLNIKDAVMLPHLNTGTLYDYAVGRYESGVNGEMLLNGGVYTLTGLNGRSNTSKSTVLNTFITRILDYYPGVEGIIYDTENTVPGLGRMEQIAGHPIDDRIKLINSDSHKAGDWHALIQKVGEEKLKNKKDFMVETPFIDPITKKAMRIMTPTLMFTDSWSFLHSDTEEELFSNNSEIDSSKFNMMFMADGMMKTRFMRALPTYAIKYGIYFLFTAHIDDKKDLDPYNPTPKQVQFMKGNDRIKYTGALYEFLLNIMMQTSPPKAMIDSKKECEYPLDKNTSPVDVSEIPLVLQRCKFNASGSTIPFVVSQAYGVLDDVTNYHYLKKNGDFGLNGNAVDKQCVFKPEVNINRKTLRQQCADDYELRRGIEILSGLLYIRNNWASASSHPALMASPKELAQRLEKSKIKNDILNTRGYWTWNKDDKRKYMSVLDIAELLMKD